MVGQALRTHLLSVGAISTAVGGNRIHPNKLPQTPGLPSITYQLVAKPVSYSLDGAAAPHPFYTIECWSDDYDAAIALADLVETALSGFRGTLGGILAVSEIVQRGRRETYESETHEHRVSLDFSLMHN